MLSRLGMAFTAALGVFALTPVVAAPDCDSPQEILAVNVAAVQQEMMVAAFMCSDIYAYNRFVLAHQAELQQADAALMDFFVRDNAGTGFDNYNLFKTELANASSLRSVSDSQFCRRVNANFAVALGRSEPLAQLLTMLPYPVSTGSVRCPQTAAQPSPGYTASVGVPQKRVRRGRTWLGRLVDAVKDAF